MTLTVLLIVAAIATLLLVRGRKRASLTLYGIATLVLLLVGSGIPANELLQSLQDGYEVDTSDWGAHNAIILLGAGSELTDRGLELPMFSYGRLTKAVELYRGCKVQGVDCRIISSGGDTHGYGKSEAELYKTVLVRLGVARADLMDETRSLNTWQNAQFTAALLNSHPVLSAQGRVIGRQPADGQGRVNGEPPVDGQASLIGGPTANAQPTAKGETFDHLVLVSSGIHVRRAALYFSHFGVHALVVRGDYVRASLGVLPNSWNFLLLDLALHEYIGILRYHVYNLLGWNAPAARPGSP